MSVARRTLQRVIVLRARLRPKIDTGERRDVRAEGLDFVSARQRIEDQTPDGWIRMFLITGDETDQSPGQVD